MIKRHIVAIILLSAIIIIPSVSAEQKSGEKINWEVISAGGGVGTSTGYRLNGTVGQTATGTGTSTAMSLHHGFWQDFGGAFVCDCEPGEVDGISPINILDIVYLVNYKFKSGPQPAAYEICSGDATCDCTVNILDIVYLVNFKFKGGSAPCDCNGWVTSCGLPLIK